MTPAAPANRTAPPAAETDAEAEATLRGFRIA